MTDLRPPSLTFPTSVATPTDVTLCFASTVTIDNVLSCVSHHLIDYYVYFTENSGTIV